MDLVVAQVKTEDVTETRTQTSRVVHIRTVGGYIKTFSVNEEQSSGVFITKLIYISLSGHSAQSQYKYVEK